MKGIELGIKIGYFLYKKYSIQVDERSAKSQIISMQNSIMNFAEALEAGDIPKNIINSPDASAVYGDIINVIFMGKTNERINAGYNFKDENGTWQYKGGAEYEKEIKDLGLKIYEKYKKN